MRPKHDLLSRGSHAPWWSSCWIATAVGALLLCLCFPGGARAEPRKRVAVLALESDMMIDDVAKALRQAICDALSERSGWEIQETQVSLAQLSLAHDCAPSDVTCLQSIAKQFELDSLLFGRMSRSEADMTVRVSRFDSATKTIERSAEATFERADKSSEALVTHGRALVSELFDVAGPLQAAAPSDAAQPASAAHTASASVSEGAETPPRSTLTAAAPTSAEPGSELSARTVAGYASLGVAAIATGLSVFSFVQIQDAQDAAGFDAYRRAVGNMRPGVEDVCSEVDSGQDYGLQPSQVDEARASCNRGKTYQLLQFVFLGSALISGGLGAFLLLGDSESPGRERQPSPSLALQPSFSRTGAGVEAQLRF